MATSPVAALAERIRHWVDSCNHLHGSECQPTPITDRPDHQIPQWVVDLQDRCLVPGRNVSRYVALSYVWPTDIASRQQLKLEMTNLKAFQKPRGLLESRMADMPKVIMDTITLLTEIGERYLWVDCLCIVQDGIDTSADVLAMGDVYSGAYFTLISAAKDGLCIRPPDRQSAKTFNDERPGHSRMQNYYDLLLRAKWGSRGWTYQEHILSKRAIFFLTADVQHPNGSCAMDVAFWDCEVAFWDLTRFQPAAYSRTQLSTTIQGRRPKMHIISGDILELTYRLDYKPWPDFGTYLDALCLYNQRDLTFPQDVLVAFSGVLNKFGGSFPGGFVNGMPHAFFDEMLLWQPHCQAARRISLDGGSLAPPRNLPSWSWCGWKCAIDPLSVRTGLAYSAYFSDIRRVSSWTTIPTVEWSILSDRSAKLATKITEAGLLAKARTSLEEYGPHNLQHGWQHTTSTPANQVPQPGWSSYTHSHDPEKHFWYPLPIQAAPSCLPKHTNEAFISGVSTICGSLRVRRFLQYYGNEVVSNVLRPPRMLCSSFKTSVFDFRQIEEEPSTPPSIITLEDHTERWAGVLRVTDNATANTGDTLELIAISQGQVSFRDLGKSFEEQVDQYEMFSYDPNGHVVSLWQKPTGDAEALQSARQKRFPDEGGPYGRDPQGVWRPVFHTLWPGGTTVNRYKLPAEEEAYECTMQRGQSSPLYGAKGEDIYQFYNVLWVDWVDGIAYRKGAGRIKKDVWEANCSEPTAVVLG